MSRADNYNITKKTPTFYSDFLINFDKNPITGFLAKVTNEDAIKQSIRNIVFTTVYERPYSRLGSKIQTLLFEPIDTVTEEMLKRTLENSIKNFEPRANVVDIQIDSSASINSYYINIFFNVINIPAQTFSLAVTLKRVR